MRYPINLGRAGGLTLCRSRTHYLLAGEALVYFALALVDLVSHRAKAIDTSVSLFKAFDISIGAFLLVSDVI